MPRLGYKKSRAGCARCKQRRRLGGSHKTQTSTSPVDQSLTPPELIEPSHKMEADFVHGWCSSLSNREPSIAASSPDPFPYLFKFTTEHVEPVHLSKWITDLELMHHYSMSTCLTLPRSNDVSQIWQFEVPKLGLTYMFLMHQVLAISALHLGHIHPEQRETYALHASQHQSDAIAGMRESLVQITTDNCHALFGASSLLVLNAYSSFPYQRGSTQHSASPTVEDILNVFLLVRGMSHILKSSHPIIQVGPFAPFFTEVVTQTSTPLLDAVTKHLQNFRSNLEACTMDQASIMVLTQEIDVFLEWILHAVKTASFPEMRVALTWPINLTEEYLQLLRNRNPAALTLLAYYCVIVRSTEVTAWFMRGWGINAARAIVLDLDPDWKDMIKWPLAFISDRSMQL
ncbi:hypothetical protein LZ30DRAFT_606728 [Colletotrichum cereale]|nr:hypothetical protein LZ30DRAFT_606728 [Colletotrichum cereale]